jgi:hypothetical protein
MAHTQLFHRAVWVGGVAGSGAGCWKRSGGWVVKGSDLGKELGREDWWMDNGSPHGRNSKGIP